MYQCHIKLYIPHSLKKQKSFESAESSSPSTSRRDLPRACLRRLPSNLKQCRRTCSTERAALHESQVGGDSPRMRKLWEKWQCPIRRRVKITSSRLEGRDEERQGLTVSFITLSLKVVLCHSVCHALKISRFKEALTSDDGTKGMSTWVFSVADFAAWSANSFPMIPTWPGTQLSIRS